MKKLKVLLQVVAYWTVFQYIPAQEIGVDFSDKKQPVECMGINMEGYHTTGGSETLKNSISEMLGSIPVNAVRIGMPLKEWERVNDNQNPDVINDRGFVASGRVANSFNRLVDMKNRSLDIWLSVWDMADWNIVDPSKNNNRRIGNLDEMAESICAYLVKARETFGVTVKWVSVNEPTIATETGYGGYNIGMSVEEQVSLIKKASKLFRQKNIETKWIIAVHSIYPSELQQARAIFEDKETKGLVAAFDFHSYWLHRDDRAEHIKAWSDWIATTGLPAYCGELDYDNNFWKRPADDKKNWITHGMITAQLYALIFNKAGASAGFPWYADRPGQSTPYRHAALHYHAHILPGYKIVTAFVSDPSLSAVAATDDRNWSIIVQNNSSRNKVVKIKGAPGSLAQVIASYNNNYGVKTDDIPITDGEIRLPMKPYSLYSLGSDLKSIPSLTVTSGGNEEIPENQVEAEDGVVGAGATVDNTQSGYTGTGYVDFGGKNSRTEIDLFFEAGGTYDFYTRYACGSKRPCDIFLNGKFVGYYSFESTGSFTRWKEVSAPVIFNPGKNTVRLVANTASGGPNIDSYRWETASGLPIAEERKIALYPNPATDILRIRGCSGTVQLTVFTLQGRIVFSSALENPAKNINISSLAPGCYYVVVHSMDKKNNSTLPLIKI